MSARLKDERITAKLARHPDALLLLALLDRADDRDFKIICDLETALENVERRVAARGPERRRLKNLLGISAPSASKNPGPDRELIPAKPLKKRSALRSPRSATSPGGVH